MKMIKWTLACWAANAWVLGSVGIGFAQENEEAVDVTEEPPVDGAETGGEGAGDGADVAGRQVLDPKEVDAEAEDADGASPKEKPGETYLFVGARYRGIIVPKFMMNLFGDGGSTVYVDSFGPELSIRKDDFEFVLSAWYADYGMDPTPFKASSDPEEAWELVESKMSVLYLTTDFLWTHPLSDQFGVNYGMSGGFGFVWGDLIREQAYPDPASDGYLPCIGEGNPDGRYCGDDNEHYRGYTEPSWSDGGSKPIVFPWLALQMGARYKPHRHFAMRADLGFGLTGFFVGIGADYGI